MGTIFSLKSASLTVRRRRPCIHREQDTNNQFGFVCLIRYPPVGQAETVSVTCEMLTPHVRAIGRPAGPAQDDAVDSARVEGTPAALKSDLVQLIGQDQVLHRISDLIRYASDASPYRYLPQVVVALARSMTCGRSWDTAPVPGGTPRSAPAARA
jgi:hypothetical protein